MRPISFTLVRLAFLIAAFVSAAEAQPVLVPSQLQVPARYQKLFPVPHTVWMPKGFSLSVYYAGGLQSARFMAFNGEDLCIADGGSSSVLMLPDYDHDGAADDAITIATGTHNAHSIAFHNGELYAASSTMVQRYRNLGMARFGDSSVFIGGISDAAEGIPNHTTRTILFDDHDGHVYLSVGSACNACRQHDSMRAVILRYDEQGRNREIYASGLRNAVGIALDSSYRLWATVAERNLMGPGLPPDLLTSVNYRSFHGWPLAFGDHVWDDAALDSEYTALLPYTAEDTALVAGMAVAEAGFEPHSTPLGLAYNRGTNLPEHFDNAFFVAIHGSYHAPERPTANGTKLMLVRPQGDRWVTEDFCTGFLTDSTHYLRWARPCGIVLDRAGNIYFSSDYSNDTTPQAIYRITFHPDGNVSESSPEAPEIDVRVDRSRVQVTVPGAAIGSIELCDLLGRRILDPVAIDNTGHSASLDLSGFSQQPLILILHSNGRTFVRKIVR